MMRENFREKKRLISRKIPWKKWGLTLFLAT